MDATTGDVYLRARHYDPSTGRFLSADTVQPNAPGTQGYNRYAYVANNPMRYTDPTGHTISDAETQIRILAGVVEKLVFVAQLFLTLLPIVALGGPFAFAIAVLFFVVFIFLTIVMLMLLGDILELLQDEFDHYKDDRSPNGEPSDYPDPEQEPEGECGYGDVPPEALPNLFFGMSDPLLSHFASCVSLDDLDLDGCLYVPPESNEEGVARTMATGLDIGAAGASGIATVDQFFDAYGGVTSQGGFNPDGSLKLFDGSPTGNGFGNAAGVIGLLAVGIGCADDVRDLELSQGCVVSMSAAGFSYAASRRGGPGMSLLSFLIDIFTIYHDFTGCFE